MKRQGKVIRSDGKKKRMIFSEEEWLNQKQKKKQKKKKKMREKPHKLKIKENGVSDNYPKKFRDEKQ